MSTIKTNLIKILSLCLIQFTLISGAQASNQVIEGLRISGLPANQSLSVFYATGRPPAVDFGGVPILRTIKKGPVKVQIDSNGQASVPQVSIPRVGFDIANFLVFVVTTPDQASAYIENPDGTVPTDARVSNPDALAPSAFTNVAQGSIGIVDLEKLKSSADASSIALQFGKDITNPTLRSAAAKPVSCD
jgi:hypothetical protein